MNTHLDRYIELVRDISSECLPPQQAVKLIAQEAAELAQTGMMLPQELRDPGEGPGHARHLIYEDATSDFVVVAMVWPAGADSLPHDHETWGVVAILEGELEITEYEGSVPGAPLRTRQTMIARAGDVDWVVPPERDLHRMRNLTGSIAISLHTYGKAIERCHAFHEATGASHEVRPTYTSVPSSYANAV